MTTLADTSPEAGSRESPSGSVSRGLVLVLAGACGLAVANLYYAQPLLHELAVAFGASPAGAGLVVTVTQAGYAVGLLFLVPFGDLLDRRSLADALGPARCRPRVAQCLLGRGRAHGAAGLGPPPRPAPRPPVTPDQLPGPAEFDIRPGQERAALRRRSLLGALGFAAFSDLWTTLAFLLSGAPYHFGFAVIGLFGLVGAAGAVCASLAGRLADRGWSRPATLSFVLMVGAAFFLMVPARTLLLPLIAGIVLLDIGVQAFTSPTRRSYTAFAATLEAGSPAPT
jgi:predicted MFS family arabinose efflux permease